MEGGGDCCSTLMSAARRNDLELAERLLEAGAKADGGNSDEAEEVDRPIHAAAARDNGIELLDLLLRSGADLEARGEGGASPLAVAAR